MHTATELAEHHRLVHRRCRGVLRHRLAPDRLEQRERRALDGCELGRCGSDEVLEPVEACELLPSEVVRTRDVETCRLTRRHDLLGRGPDLVDEARLEVTECRPDHARLDVTQHTATPEEVEAEPVETGGLAPLEGARVEVEGRSDVTDVSGRCLHDVTWIHGRRVGRPEVRRPVSDRRWIRTRRCDGSRRSVPPSGSHRLPVRRATTSDPWRPRVPPAPCRHGRSRHPCRARG